MNGGMPPFFGMFGGPGMPQLAQAAMQQAQQQQKAQQGQATSNNPFMNGAAQAVFAQAQQQQQRQASQGVPNPLFMANHNGRPPMPSIMPNATQQQNTPQQQQQQAGAPNPMFLANAARMAGNTPNMNNNAQQRNPQQEQQQQQQQQQQAAAPNALFLANAARMVAGNAPNNNAPNNISLVVPQDAPKPKDSKPKDILQPHDHDVMCGRGGLTNFHRGNVWYRRLVKCNRPLYRESAKYTKLLVSKAIVQAVHSQNPPGRFIECEKESGIWHEIPYKKALDKTSQALREKDKDGEDDDGELEGLNLTLVRIPLPEDGSRNTQVAVNTPPPIIPPMRPNMPFPPQNGMAFPPGMTPQQQANIMQAAAAMGAAGMNPQGNMTPAQQANAMQQASRMMTPGQQANVMQAAQAAAMGAAAGKQQANMMPQQANNMSKGPTVNSSQQANIFQNLPPQLAEMLQNHPMMVQGKPASGAPRVLGPTGVPRNMGPADVPRAMPPSSVPINMPNSNAPRNMPQAGMPQANMGQVGMPPSNMGQVGMPPSNMGQVGMPPGGVRGPIGAPNASTSTMSRNPSTAMPPNGSPPAMAPKPISIPGFGTAPAPQDMAPAATPASKGPASSTAALEGLAHIAAVQAKAPTLNAPQAAQQFGVTQQPNMQHQAGMKRHYYPNQMQQAGTEQFKRRRVEGDLTPLPALTLERQSSSMAEFLREAKLVVSKGASSGPTQMPDLNKMTPQQTQQFALQLLQFAQQQQAQQDAEKAQQQEQASRSGSQQFPPFVSPAQSALRPPSLNRQEHSLGSVGKTNDTTPLPDRGIPPEFSGNNNAAGLEPPQLKQQVSDWLQHFFPVQQEASEEENKAPTTTGDSEALPPPPALEQSVSEALLSLATGPTKFLSGLSTLFDRSESIGDSSTGSTGPPPSDLRSRPSMVSTEAQNSTNLQRKSSSTTQPQMMPMQRNNSSTAQSQMMPMQRRPTGRTIQEQMMPMQRRPTGRTIQEQMMSLQRRPGGVTIQEQMMSLQRRPSGRTIQEQMLSLQRRSSGQPMQRQLPALAPRPTKTNQRQLPTLAPRPTGKPPPTLAPRPSSTSKTIQEQMMSVTPGPSNTSKTIQEQMLSLKPRASAGNKTSEDQMASLKSSNSSKTIQEQMSDIIRKNQSLSESTSTSASTPEIPPMLQLKRSETYQASKRKPKQSLLDDYEETPLEARMRAVGRK